MQRKLILASMLAFAGLAGAGGAMAQSTAQSTTQNGTADVSQEQLFMSAKVSLDQAKQIALKQVPGTISAIGFNDENGMGVYEATVVGADGTASIIKIDANTAAVLASGQASLIGDEGNEGDGGASDTEQNGGENVENPQG